MFSWGFGIEKEFPINIGPYKIQHYNAKKNVILKYMYDRFEKEITIPEIYELLLKLKHEYLEKDLSSDHDIYIDIKDMNFKFFSNSVWEMMRSNIYIEAEGLYFEYLEEYDFFKSAGVGSERNKNISNQKKTIIII